jgi:WD40 repeat protein/class 3 adenylate cyclase/ABC-type cobalamin/Fe3+-siderophores transport system ATPase subunit
LNAKGPSPGILTFLIADIRGYTTFTQQRGDEAAGRLAGKFAELCREGIEANGGELTELRGDEALAVFASPRGALRAAADLQAVFADESAVEPALPLTIGIGVDAGEAVAVEGGYRGGALNLAARLCSKAAAGEVLVSQGVALLARAVEGILLEEHGKVEMKGLAEPVQVFRLHTAGTAIAAPTHPQELPAALVTVTPIFGRDTELRRLRWMWRMARRGKGRIVVVAGPAGIGKTRLLAELAATVASGGGETIYRSFAAATPPGERETVGDHTAGLTVIDDLECAPADDVRGVTDQLSDIGSRLVALAFNDDESSPELLKAAHALATGGGGFIRPQPLDVEQMLRIAGLYVGTAAGTLPRDVLTTTGGVPRKVHEQVSEWAHAQAARRLGSLATQAASDRGGLRSVEADLAGTVIDFQTVREQTRLYGIGPGRHAAEPSASPYRGLASFDVSDAELFFGRERLVAELISRLAGAPLLGVVGPSGSGKSSAVRAGLVPALSAGVLPDSGGWTIALMRPGEHPLRALERALYSTLPKAALERMGATDSPLVAVRDVLDAHSRLVLVIDQFEETFTACSDTAERDGFLAGIADAASDPRANVTVIAAIRADFYGRCAAHAGLAELLAANHVLVGPMTAEEYRRAIVQPALRVGVDVERELVDELVGEVMGEPGALPLLSTTLLELWDRREGRTIRRQAYLATGGVRGAVARLAEEVYGAFDLPEQAVARSILLRLAGSGEGDAVVRRRVALAEFDVERNSTAAHVLDVLADRRLVTVSEGTVEVAHEALLREWPRLQDWLEEDREGRRLHSHLTSAAREWNERGRDPAELYRGARLSTTLDWTTQHTLDLNELERDFVTSSRSQSQRDLARQQRQNRRLRGLLVGVAALLILAMAAGSIAFAQSRSAENQARLALARQLGAEAVGAPRIDQAMLLARQAVLLDSSAQTTGTLLATLLRSPAVLGTFAMPLGLRPLALTLSPTGGTLAVTENNGEVRFFDTGTFKESGTRLADYGGLPAGTVLYAGTHFIAPHTPSDGLPTLDVFDAQTMHRIRSLQFTQDFLMQNTGPFDPVVASLDGNSVYFAWTLVNDDGSDGAAFVDSWNLASGDHRLMPLGARGVLAATALPGDRLAVVTDSAVLTLDGTTLDVLHSTPEQLGPTLAAISPDGSTLAFGVGSPRAPSNTFSLLDIATGQQTPVGSGHTAPLDQLAFTPDGHSVVSTSEDARVIVWDAATGAPTETLTGHSGRVVGQATDGRTLYTSSLDGVVFAWDLGAGRRFGRAFDASSTGPLPLPSSVAPALAVSPDSSRFAVRSGEGRLSVFDVRTLQSRSTLATGADPVAVAWSKSNQLAVATDSGGIQLWDVRGTPQRGRELSGVSGSIRALAFSPDGRTLAEATVVQAPVTSPKPPDGWLGIWDNSSGRLLRQLHLETAGLAVAFDPGGSLVAVGAGQGKVFVVDASSGRTTRTLNLATAAVQPAPVWAVAWHGADTLLTGNNAGIAQHWNVKTGAEVGHAVLAEGAPVASIDVSPDGATFATSGGSSGDLKLWDDSSLQQFGATFAGAPGLWGNALYTPDGSSLIVVYADGRGALWPVLLSAWMDHACAVAKRNFTREEWARFVPGHDYARTCPQFPAGV